MKAHLVTLGCPKNLVDSEAARGFLEKAGCSMVEDPCHAGLLIVNACSFLDAAWGETLDELERLAALKKADPKKVLVLMGCLPLHRLRWREELPQVDFLLPTGAHARLGEIVEGLKKNKTPAPSLEGNAVDRFAGFERRPRLTPAHLAYVKISEGCDRACSFCAIPVIRGRLRCRTIESIVREVEGMRAEGVREISLVAQDLTSFRDGGRRLPELIDAVAQTGIEWIRACYVHPASLGPGLARSLFRHPAVCRYLEVPVQHASDRILRGMRRGYTRGLIVRALDDIREEFPDLMVRSEVMVGFPGEDEDDFQELKDFVEAAGFSSLGIFTYSPESGTEAASSRDRVPQAVAAERAAEISDLQSSISFALLSAQRDRVHRVLVDRALSGGAEGHPGCSHAGRYYGQAYEIDGEVFLRGADVAPGEFVNATITRADVFDLEGVVEKSQRP